MLLKVISGIRWRQAVNKDIRILASIFRKSPGQNPAKGYSVRLADGFEGLKQLVPEAPQQETWDLYIGPDIYQWLQRKNISFFQFFQEVVFAENRDAFNALIIYHKGPGFLMLNGIHPRKYKLFVTDDPPRRVPRYEP